MKRIVLGMVFSAVIVAAVPAAPVLQARTTDGRDVVRHADGDIADLILYQAVESTGAVPTVIRLRVYGEGGSQVGTSP